MNTGGLGRAPRVAWFFTLLGFCVAVVCAYLSDGVHQADDLKHLQIARWSLEDPRYLLDAWGRPGFTILYALPAQAGNFAARIFSALLSAASAWLLYRAALRMRCPAPAWVPLFLWIQPLFLALACTTLTETALVFYFVVAFSLWQTQRFHWSAIFISLAILTRHEAAVFAGIWALDAWRRRSRWMELLCLASAPLVHNLLSTWFIGLAPASMFVQPKPTELYGSGAWLTMTLHAAIACSGGLLLLAGAGASTLAKRSGGWLLIACALTWWATHTVVYRFGLFASAGYPRFLVPMAPVVALAAAAALGRSAEAFRSRSLERVALRGFGLGTAGMSIVLGVAFFAAAPEWMAWARPQCLTLAVGAAILGLAIAFQPRLHRWAIAVPIYALGTAGYEHLLLQRGEPRTSVAVPFQQNAEQRLVREALEWIATHRGVATKQIGFNWWFDELTHGSRPFRPPTPDECIDALEPGSLVVWTLKHDPMEHPELKLEHLHQRGDLREVYVGSVFVPFGQPFVRVLEKRNAE